MSYIIGFTDVAKDDIKNLIESGEKLAIVKLYRLFDELEEHPKTGTGKPKMLKGDLSGCWSRRITDKHRLVYRIEDKTVTVVVFSCHGHYGDK